MHFCNRRQVLLPKSKSPCPVYQRQLAHLLWLLFIATMTACLLWQRLGLFSANRQRLIRRELENFSVTDQQILLLSFCFVAPDASQDYNARNKMARSLLRRLLGQRQPSQGQGQQVSPTTSTTKDQRHLTSLGLASERPGVEPIPKRVSLFAFVDPKDPFTPGEIAGEHFIGPVLSIMSARQIDSLFLFHTPHTHENARATEKELSARFPACRVELYELPVSDPKDYSSLMAQLARQVRLLMAQFAADINYVCVSSGTAEMRAAWFLLTAIGVLPAKLLQVGTPAKPLFGEANVREVVDTKDWQAIRDLLMPAMYISPRILREAPRDAPPSDDAPIFGRGHRQAKTTSAPSPSIPPAAPRRLRLGDVSKQPGVDGASPSTDTESEPFAVPGLESALRELGIYVGSAVLRHAAERAGIAADSHLPILLLGETGTGKERFAHLIHRLSPRFPNNFVAINCAAIPKDLAESYLFGHVKGSFTGATGDKKGMFESADQSTLFLDEIGELTLEVQAKLLRVVQDGEVQCLGTTASRRIDVRIIAATNRDLRKEVSMGRFREDLYFRLEVAQIKLPALRDRRSEIAELALVLLRQINQRRLAPRYLSKDALLRLQHYDWPGNVRELSNVLERSVLWARSEVLAPDDLLITDDPPTKDPFATLPEPFEGFSIERYVSQIRKQLFMRALAKCNGNQADAAALLGISKQAVNKFIAGRVDNRS